MVGLIFVSVHYGCFLSPKGSIWSIRLVNTVRLDVQGLYGIAYSRYTRYGWVTKWLYLKKFFFKKKQGCFLC
jgi:hypothetical protein